MLLVFKEVEALAHEMREYVRCIEISDQKCEWINLQTNLNSIESSGSREKANQIFIKKKFCKMIAKPSKL